MIVRTQRNCNKMRIYSGEFEIVEDYPALTAEKLVGGSQWKNREVISRNYADDA